MFCFFSPHFQVKQANILNPQTVAKLLPQTVAKATYLNIA